MSLISRMETVTAERESADSVGNTEQYNRLTAEMAVLRVRIGRIEERVK